MIDALMPKIKQERSPSPAPLESAPPVQFRTEGSDLIPMRADCVKGAPNYYEKRQEWKEEVVRQYAAMGRQVKLLIRADGMAVDWVLAPSSETNDAVDESSQEQDLPTGETRNNPRHAPDPQLSDATLAVARSALERLGVPAGSGADVPVAPTLARSPSSEASSSDSSGLAPRKRKRPLHSRISSPDRGTTSKHRRHQGHEATLAGPPLETEGHIGLRLEQHKSKKRKKSSAPESESLPPQPDEITKSSTPKAPKEKILKILPIYEESDETVARMFLMQFLRLFDTNRSALRDAYHPEATFSYQISLPSKSGWNTDGTHPRLFAPLASALGLTRPDRNPGHPRAEADGHLGDRRVGSTEIIQCLHTLKNWIHGSSTNGPQDSDISRRFVWSISSLPVKALDPTVRKPKRKPSWRTGMVLDCHGDLVDPTNPLRCLSFDRTFVLKQNGDPASKDYWPCVILSDQLTIRPRSEHPPRKDDETELF